MNFFADLAPNSFQPGPSFFWAGLVMALAFSLLLKNFGRHFFPWTSRASGPSGPAAGGAAGWAPSLEMVDRRRSFRRAGNPVAVLLVGLDGNRRFEGRIFDRSRGGIRVESPRPAPVDSYLLVRPCQAPADLPWVPVKVRWCRVISGTIHIGCQFADELPLATLQLFG